MPRLLAEALPPGLLGAAIVGLLAAVLSSIDSQLNAFQTFFTQRVYRNYFRPSSAEGHYVRVGRIVGVIFMVLTIGMAYVFSLQPLMFIFAQSLLATIMPTFATVALLGGLWDRVTTKAALIGGTLRTEFSALFSPLRSDIPQLYPRSSLHHTGCYDSYSGSKPSHFTERRRDPTNFLRKMRENLDEAIAPRVRRVAVTVVAYSEP